MAPKTPPMAAGRRPATTWSLCCRGGLYNHLVPKLEPAFRQAGTPVRFGRAAASFQEGKAQGTPQGSPQGRRRGGCFGEGGGRHSFSTSPDEGLRRVCRNAGRDETPVATGEFPASAGGSPSAVLNAPGTRGCHGRHADRDLRTGLPCHTSADLAGTGHERKANVPRLLEISVIQFCNENHYLTGCEFPIALLSRFTRDRRGNRKMRRTNHGESRVRPSASFRRNAFWRHHVYYDGAQTRRNLFCFPRYAVGGYI